MSSRKAKYGQYVAVTRDVLHDPEFKQLKPAAMIVWIYLRSKFNRTTWVELTLCPSELKGVMGGRTFRRAIERLIEMGWIETVFHGGLPRIKNRYKLKGQHGYFIYKGMKIQ